MPGDRSPIEGGLRVTQEPDFVSLNQEVERVGLQGLSVADQVTLRNAELRDWVAKGVIPAFLKANMLTLGAIGILVVLDEFNLYAHLTAPGDRIITSQVIMTLLGATTVQVGAIAYAIARYLFPGRT